MPTHSEAPRLNLEYFRKAAKALLKAAQSGDASALERLTRYSVKTDQEPALHQAQLAIAREQGFASWPRFRAFLQESSLNTRGLADEFVRHALSDLRRAEEMLAQHPEIAGVDLYSALVVGDVRRVERALAESPDLAKAKGGPRIWEPLLYVCFSRFAHGRSSRAGDLVETARALLASGADPNTSYIDERWEDNPLSCLYAATGLNDNPALGRLLLAAGARPDDGESVYHSTEHSDLICLRLLFEYGASLRGTNALKHMLDREDMEGLRLLLEAGADPNELNHRGETALHWAVWRGRSAAIVAALLDAGADIDARRPDGRTAYALALRSGQTETAALLARRGANTEVSALDRFLGRCATVDAADLSKVLEDAPENPAEYEHLLPEFAASHQTEAVRGLLAAGVPVNARGEHGGTALHWACWKGYADLVKLLVDAGASLTIEDHSFHAPPSGWFTHGLENCGEGGGDYAQVARLLLAAGVTLPAGDLPTGDAKVDAVLREHKWI
ncbi:MAG TPA: ankyrin repeat domain-containing protein [Bryobacteraceae bacterium]